MRLEMKAFFGATLRPGIEIVSTPLWLQALGCDAAQKLKPASHEVAACAHSLRHRCAR